MTLSTCNYRRNSWTPALLLLTLALLTIKLTDPHPWLAAKLSDPSSRQSLNNSQAPNELSLSPSLANISTLALTCKRPFVSLYSMPNKNCGCMSLFLIMIVQCGDVESNPGPIKFPCMTCHQPVASNHRAMGCEECDMWVHIKCCGVTPAQYAAFQRGESTCPWRCPVCDPVIALADLSSSDSESSNLSDHSELSTSTTDSTQHGLTTDTSYKRNVDKIKISVINLNSVFGKGKGAALKAHICDTQADIIIANESNLTEERVDSDFLPPNYQAIRVDKSVDKHGVFVAYREELVVTPVKIPDTSCEFVLTKLEVFGHPDLYIGSFYRHTNSDKKSLKSLYDNVAKITGGKKFPNIIIGGDFNLPDANWDSGSYNAKPQYGKEVNELGLEVMSDLFLTQLVTEPDSWEKHSRPALQLHPRSSGECHGRSWY